MQKVELKYLFFSVVLCVLVFHIWLSVVIPGIEEDCFNYVLSAYKVIKSNFSFLGFGWREHPGFVFLHYLLSVVLGNPFWAGKVISILSTLLVYFFIILLAYKFCSIETSFFAWIYLLLLMKVNITFNSVLSGPLFTCLVLVSFFCFMNKKFIYSFFFLSLSILVRSEAAFLIFFFIIAVICIKFKDKKITDALGITDYLLIFLGFLSICFWLFIYGAPLLNKKSPQKEIIDRFGDKSFVEFYLQKFSSFLAFLSSNNHFLKSFVLFLMLMSFVVTFYCLFVFVKRRNLLPCYKLNLTSFVIFLLGVNTLIFLFLLKMHPLAQRHFLFLIPFYVLWTASSFYILLSKIKNSFVMNYSFFLFVFGIIIFYFPLISLKPIRVENLLFKYKNGKIGSLHIGKYIASHLKASSQERYIAALPSVIYYTNLWDYGTRLYPKDILNVKAYLKNKIKYVAFSNIYAQENLPALNKLHFLNERRDVLFFKFIFSPPKGQIGWDSILYEIDPQLLMMVSGYVDKGWYKKEKWGRWIKGNLASVIIWSPSYIKTTLKISASSLIMPAKLKISLNKNFIKEVVILPKKGANMKMSSYTFEVFLQSGFNILKFNVCGKSFVPAKLGLWNDYRKLSVGISELKVGNYKII